MPCRLGLAPLNGQTAAYLRRLIKRLRHPIRLANGQRLDAVKGLSEQKPLIKVFAIRQGGSVRINHGRMFDERFHYLNWSFVPMAGQSLEFPNKTVRVAAELDTNQRDAPSKSVPNLLIRPLALMKFSVSNATNASADAKAFSISSCHFFVGCMLA